MRIVCANDQPFPLAEADCEQIAEMVSALGAEHADVELWTLRLGRGAPPTADDVAAYYGVEPSFRLVALPGPTRAPRWAQKLVHARRCVEALADRAPEVLWTRNLATAALVLERTRCPVLFETYRPLAHQYPALRPVLGRLLTHRRLLGVVAHSRLAGASLCQAGLSDDRLLVAHNARSPGRMEPVLSVPEARAQVGLPPDRPVVLYAGHVNETKGLESLLDLAPLVPDALFVLVGVVGRNAVVRRAERISNVRLVTRRSVRGTVPYLYAADVLVIPPSKRPLEHSKNTVVPLKTFVYMAAGRAILGPRTPDVLEVLRDDHNAALVPPDDPAAAAARLSRLLAREDLRRRLGAQALADSAGNTWRARARRMLAFCEARLSRAPDRPVAMPARRRP